MPAVTLCNDRLYNKYIVHGELLLQTDEGRKITRNYNKMATVLLEYEASLCFSVLLYFQCCTQTYLDISYVYNIYNTIFS